MNFLDEWQAFLAPLGYSLFILGVKILISLSCRAMKKFTLDSPKNESAAKEIDEKKP